MAKQMKSVSDLLLVGPGQGAGGAAGCKLKVMMSCHFTPLDLGKTNKTNNKSYWWDTGRR